MLIDYYEVLSLNRDDALEDIRFKLEHLARGWSVRAARSGEVGDKAKEVLGHVAQARECFADQASRERYDTELLEASRVPETAEEPQTDWVTKSWNYFYADELVAAEIAADKARSARREDVEVLVLSAVVEMAVASRRAGSMAPQERYAQAQRYADEAMVLDTSEAFTVEIYEMRGRVLLEMGDFRRAAASFERAMTAAQGDGYVHLASLKARCLPPQEAAGLCLTVLSENPVVDQGLVQRLTEQWMESVDDGAPQTGSWSDYASYFQVLDGNVRAAGCPASADMLAFLERKMAVVQQARSLAAEHEDLSRRLGQVHGSRADATRALQAGQAQLTHQVRPGGQAGPSTGLLVGGAVGCLLVPLVVDMVLLAPFGFHFTWWLYLVLAAGLFVGFLALVNARKAKAKNLLSRQAATAQQVADLDHQIAGMQHRLADIDRQLGDLPAQVRQAH